MTTTETDTTIRLAGREWRALALHAHPERTRYAMTGAAHLPTPPKLPEWLDGATPASVVATTNGKQAMLLATSRTAPADLRLIPTPPKPKATKRERSDEATGATVPNGTDGHFPPIADVVTTMSGYGKPFTLDVDTGRALCALAFGDSDTPLRLRLDVAGRGLTAEVRDVALMVSVKATLGTVDTTGDGDPIGIDAVLLRRVLDSAEELGIVELRCYVKDHRSAMVLTDGARVLFLVMPMHLGA